MTSSGTDAKKGKKVYYFDPSRVVIIGLDTDHGPEHPLWDRRAFDALDEGLVKNILQRGVRTPIKYRVVDGQVQVVDGRQRVKHAREAVRRQIEAGVPELELIRVSGIPEHGTDADMVAVKRASNLSRPDELLDKAKDALRLLQYGRDEVEIAIDLKVDVATIRGYVALVDADTALLNAISEGRISPTAALRLAKLSHRDQREALENLLTSGRPPTVVEARRIANKVSGREEGIGVSRKVIRRMRTQLQEQNEADDYAKGFAAALDVVLGVGKPDTRARKLVEQASAAPARKKVRGAA
jgi:ParB family transcriptional regulator, chromosome partitioning protein